MKISSVVNFLIIFSTLCPAVTEELLTSNAEIFFAYVEKRPVILNISSMEERKKTEEALQSYCQASGANITDACEYIMNATEGKEGNAIEDLDRICTAHALINVIQSVIDLCSKDPLL